MSLLSFDRPATRWLECLPLGNGALGVMHDGGVPVTRLALNDETAWSGSPTNEAGPGLIGADRAARALADARAALAAGDPGAAESSLAAMQARYTQAFLPLGEIVIRRAASGDGYSRSLDLATAVHELRSGGLIERTFVSAPQGVLVHVSSGAIEVDIQTQLRELWRRADGDDLVIGVRMPTDLAPKHEAVALAAAWSDEPGAALEGAIASRLLPADARGRRVLLVATATTFGGLGEAPFGTAEDAAARAIRRLDEAARLGADRLLEEHIADHGALFDRARIDLGSAPVDGDEPLTLDRRLDRAFAGPAHPLAVDPGLAALLFDFGRYLAIASSRPGGLPATLQGIWNANLQPPWSSNYTINVNTQMNYWSAYPTDLAETAEPLIDFVLALAEAGRATAARLYGARGWAAHHNSDAWLFSNPVGGGHGDARWTAWPLAGAWLARNLWEGVAHGDLALAERIWPAVRGAAEFALDWHHRDQTGAWVTAPATSPENAYLAADGSPVAVDSTTAMDQSLLHDLFTITVELAALLDRSGDAVATAARERLPLLAAEPSVAAANGTVEEWAAERTEEDPHHRHLSPLYGLHPGPGRWSAAARAAAAATLERRGDDSSGWSLVWKAALWARLGRGDKVSDLLRLLFREGTEGTGGHDRWKGGLYPNLFAAHPPFQIDANLGFPGLLVECILQSHDGIELLPALPAELGTGSARGLVARPGLSVDLSWHDGALDRVSLRARTAAAEVRIGYRDRVLVRRIAEGVATEIDATEFEQAGARR